MARLSEVEAHNFWFNAYIDGVPQVVSGGPELPQGGMQSYFYMRERGRIGIPQLAVFALRQHGELLLCVYDMRTHDKVYERVTER